MLDLLYLIPAVLAGSILIMSIATGKAIDAMPLRRPVIVRRLEKPREYWTGVYVEALLFALAIWFFIA